MQTEAYSAKARQQISTEANQRIQPLRQFGRGKSSVRSARLFEIRGWSFYTSEPCGLVPKPRLRGLIRLGRSF